MTFGNSKKKLTKHQFLFTCIKSHCVTWFLVISDHRETKDFENQYCDSVIPGIYHFIGNQDKNGSVCLVIKQQFRNLQLEVRSFLHFFAVGPY